MQHWRVLLAVWLVCTVVHAQDVPVVRFTVDRFEIVGDNPLSARDADRALAGFMSDFEGVDGLLAAADALESALAKAGYSLHRVTVPPQTLSSGTVQLKVIAFRLGDIVVEGNTHFSDANIRRSVPTLSTAMAPSTSALARAVDIANRPPGKKISVNLRQSDRPDAIDAVLQVRDGKPWQAYATLNNIGSEQSGRARLSLGGQYNNLFDRDHSFTANYTTSPGNADNVRQYGVHYRAPIYRYAASFSAFYTHSKVDTGTIGDFFDVSGSGDFYGFNFNQILRNIGRYSHEWFAGIQDRSFENDVSFSGIPIGIDVRSRPVTVGYSGRFRTDDAVMGFSISYSRNWSAGAQNNQRVYAAARSEGDVEWDALGIDGYVNYYLPRDWIARGVIAGQYSDEALIAGEQFGLGGADSVRGFEERIVTGDTGLRLTAELWTPQLPFVPGLPGVPKTASDLLKVAIIGAIGAHKGSDILLGCARDAQARKLNIRYVVIGYTNIDRKLRKCRNVEITGRYRESEVGELVQQQACTLAFLPSVWPETYCYTLSVAFGAGLYPVAFDIGALGERIKDAGFGTVLPIALMTQPAKINDYLLEVKFEPREADSPLGKRYESIIGEYYGL